MLSNDRKFVWTCLLSSELDFKISAYTFTKTLNRIPTETGTKTCPGANSTVNHKNLHIYLKVLSLSLPNFPP